MNSGTIGSKLKAEKRASSGIPNSKLTQPKVNSSGSRTPSPSNQSARSRNSNESNDTSINKNKSPLAILEPSQRDASPAPTTADNTLEIDISQQVEPPRISKNGRCLTSCPCNQSNPSDWKIDCSSCGQLWHLDCVGLKGLSKAAMGKLLGYKCPFCYVAPINTMETSESVCYVCRNTLVLQEANNSFEVVSAVNTLKSMSSPIQQLGSMDLEKLYHRLDKVDEFDLHLTHFLVQEKLSTKERSESNHALAQQITDLKKQLEVLKETRDPAESNTGVAEMSEICKDLMAELKNGMTQDLNLLGTTIQSASTAPTAVTIPTELEEWMKKERNDKEAAEETIKSLGSAISELQAEISSLKDMPKESDKPTPAVALPAELEEWIKQERRDKVDLGETIKNLGCSMNELKKEISVLKSERPAVRIPSGLEVWMKQERKDKYAAEDTVRKLESSLKELKTDIGSIKSTATPPPSLTMQQNHEPSPSMPVLDHGLNAHDEIIPEFLQAPEADDLINSLSKEMDKDKFKSTRGRKVLLYGAEYSYPGSKDLKPQQVPEFLKPLMSRVNEIQQRTFHEKYPDMLKYKKPAPIINSCLINRYEGADCFLPEHSDNEESIHPESSILTISLGSSCTLRFKEIKYDTETSLTCPERSMYMMTRKSQDFFTHRIDEGEIFPPEGVRFSLTFRSVAEYNKNSTCLIGDSNTGHLQFGDQQRGSFGNVLPGQRFWAPCTHDIDPRVCIAYKNVVIMCGTNDVRKRHVRRKEDLGEILKRLQQKIEEIRALNPSCSILICPVLPTKDSIINEKVFDYCVMIRQQLVPKLCGVRYVPGFDRFLDTDWNLSRDLSKQVDRYGQPDILHLNSQGTRVLARLIKQCIFQKGENQASTRVDGVSYAMVTSRPSRHDPLS